MVWLILILLEICLIVLFWILKGTQRKIYKQYRFAVLVGVITLFLLIPVLFFPYLFTTKCFMEIDFKNSGQIGDTVGGIMGPFIAIIVAFLTFMAFWVQYKANEQLRVTNEAQNKTTAIEQFENNFFELIHLHKQNLDEISIANFKGRRAIEEFYYDFILVYNIIESILKEKKAQTNENNLNILLKCVKKHE